MGLFRRRSAARGPDERVTAFWDWWLREGRSAAEQSISGGADPQVFARAMAEQVGRLGTFGWELAAGDTSEHVLVITAEGDPAQRAGARRVVLAAPDADATWSYIDSRPPTPDPESVVLSAGGTADIEFSKVQVSARLEGGRFDVQVHHPAFPELPAETRTQIAFLALDAALGEVDTELWLGEVAGVEFPPLDGFGLSALRSVVHDLKRQRLDQDGNPRWVMLQGETTAGTLLATAQSPLHPLLAPHLDTYVAVVLPYADRTEQGLPGEGSLGALRTFEERLTGRLGTSGTIVAHQSSAGVRTLHVYVDSTAGLLPTVTEVARSWDQGQATVHDMTDPGWAAVQHLRG